MKLYEINEQIMALTDQIQVDPETGEVTADTEALLEQVEALHMERKEVLEYLAKTVLNLRADEAAIKAEEERLKKRREHMEKRETSIMGILDRECAGEKMDLGVATIRYTKGNPLIVENESAVIDWLTTHGHDDLVRYSRPSLDKTAVKRLLGSGVSVPGCTIGQTNNITLK